MWGKNSIKTSILQMVDKANRRFLKTQPPVQAYRNYMDEVAPNSEGKRESIVSYFRVQKSLAVWLLRVEKWDGVRKYCMVFIQISEKTDDIEVC